MMTRDNYMVPDESDSTFDTAAAEVMRACLLNYANAPNEVRSLLENIAILQDQLIHRLADD